MEKDVDGYLLVDKPLGWTSFDVVNKVRRKLATEMGVRSRQLKVGHAGTLDPLATGLLVILVGKYTKKQADFMKRDKTYHAEIRLGQTSETDDGEGKKVTMSKLRPGRRQVEDTLSRFTGRMEQIPPKFSAIKVGGKPAYARARAGQHIKLEPRAVEVYSIESMEYEYPKLSFTCRVSSGTYVRSLARDIGVALKTGAYLSGLRRTHIGDMEVKGAIKTEQLDKESIQKILQS